MTPEALVERGAEMGYTAMGMVDAADLGGIVRFGLEARERGVRPIVGSEILVDGRPLALLARNERGFRNLSGLVTLARVKSRRGRPGVSSAELMRRSEGLHLLTGGAAGELPTLLRAGRQLEARQALARWREPFEGRLAVEVQLHHASGEEAALSAALIELAERSGVPWVATNEPRYLDDRGRLAHDLFTALRAGTDIDTAAQRGLLLPNGEWRLKSPEEMARLWAGGEAGLEESARIASECDFELRWLRPPLPSSGEDEDLILQVEVEKGALERWGSAFGEKERRQIAHELGVIRRLGFAGFFLVMYRAIRFARGQGILCQGRGSAANSTVAFCLGITAVDPVKHNLLFERFLSEARTDGLTEAPDIDVDFEMHRREEVLDYIYNSYDRDHAAITCVTQTYHAPSALQDVMRALGYPPEQAAPISKRLHHCEPEDGAEVVAVDLATRFGIDLECARGRALLEGMRAMQDLPRMRSTHPGGFVLSGVPLGEYIPIEETTMGRTILQFDKDDLDAVGVPKFDFLGLGGLTAIRIAFDSIELRTGHRFDLYNLPQDDEKTFREISKGNTVGTFQIESRAQIQSILQTKPEYLYDLVVQVALIRPGPIQGDFVHPYTNRRRGLEEWQHDHPALEPILQRTYGIPIFQEQAMSIAMALGGYSAAEADALRRAMGHKRKAKKLEDALVRLRQRLQSNGLTEELSTHIIEQMKGFANYGFPESHAWSFALIAYATAFLKAHYPADFLLGLLNAWPMGFYSPATLVHDARRNGVTVLPPCLKEGAWECDVVASCQLPVTSNGVETDHPELETGNWQLATPSSELETGNWKLATGTRIGWRHIRGMGKSAMERLKSARVAGPFQSVEDVVRRARLSRMEALHLARAGAFEAFEPGRRRAAWEALRAAGDVLPLAPARRLPFDPRELEGSERIFLDYLATGICTDGHPVQHLRERLKAAGVASSADLERWPSDHPVVVAGLVVARQHPSTSKGTVFLLVEDEHGLVNVIVPAKLYVKNQEVVKYSPFLLIEGRFEREGAVINVIGFRFRQLKMPVLSAQSHDFH